MPREQKLGFTLLILMIGLTTAYCFRKADDQRARPPRLQQEDSINQQMVDDYLIPYFPGINSTANRHPDQSVQDAHQWVQEEQEHDHNSDPTTSIPPIAMIQNIDDRSPFDSRDMRHTELTESAVVPDPYPVNDPSDNNPFPQSEQQIINHEIQPGETLSGIAYHYFGSAQHYLKLFQDNRDVISSPNEIRPGMVLKIVLPVDDPSHAEPGINSRTDTLTIQPFGLDRFSNSGSENRHY